MAGKKKKKVAEKDCSRCTRDGEAFRCYKNTFKFDIDLAREIIADGREPVELEPDDIEYSLDRCELNEGHIDHVDPSYPGIVSHVFYPDKDGSVHHVHRLIDGHHRAARCLRDKIPFYIHVLSEEESVRILYFAPPAAKPEHLVKAIKKKEKKLRKQAHAKIKARR